MYHYDWRLDNATLWGSTSEPALALGVVTLYYLRPVTGEGLPFLRSFNNPMDEEPFIGEIILQHSSILDGQLAFFCSTQKNVGRCIGFTCIVLSVETLFF